MRKTRDKTKAAHRLSMNRIFKLLNGKVREEKMQQQKKIRKQLLQVQVATDVASCMLAVA